MSNVFFSSWSETISKPGTFHTLAFCLAENWVSLEMIRKVIVTIFSTFPIKSNQMLFQKYQKNRSHNPRRLQILCHFALLFIAGPVTRIQSVSGMLTNLPCNITPSSPTDRVNIVLWYKDGLGKPFYR